MAMENEAGDLLLGAGKIAAFLGIAQRQVYRLADANLIPTFKVGGTLSSRRSLLSEWMEKVAGL